MKRTWYKGTYSGRIFRNCALISHDQRKPVNWLPWRALRLAAEYRDTWRKGAMEPGSRYNPGEPAPGDIILPWDDNPEAITQRTADFIARYGSRGGQTRS